MTSHKIKLNSKKEVAKDTISFFFTKPKEFKFIAGQYCDFFLPEVPKSKFETGIRSLSIASAPFEKEIMITIRNRKTGFKERLNSMPIGSKMTMHGPQGDFNINTGKNNLVLIAGGIGITPFRSLIQQATHDKHSRNIFLFYFNRDIESTAFLEELKSVKNEKFHLIPVMTRDKNWPGEKGHLTMKMLEKNISDFFSFIPSSFQYYIAGSPEMVRRIKEKLLIMNIPEESIFKEEFDGY